MLPKRLFTAIVLMAPLAGCPSYNGTPAKEAATEQGSVAQTLDKPEEADLKDVARVVRAYSYALKDQFVADMNKELARIQVDLDRLSAEVDASSGDAKSVAQRKFDGVRERWAHAKERLAAVQEADENTWEDVKKTFADSHTDLKAALDDSRQWLSEKIAP